jgi:hypothetical protein
MRGATPVAGPVVFCRLQCPRPAGDKSSSTIVAVTSFGLNELCRGTDFAYRIDRQPVLDWISNTPSNP